MSLNCYLAQTTHRQHITWVAWLDQQQNEVDKHDSYQMQIARELALLPWRVWGKNPPRLSLSDFQVKFEKAVQQEAGTVKPLLSDKAIAEVAKAKWTSMMGCEIEVAPARTAEEQAAIS